MGKQYRIFLAAAAISIFVSALPANGQIERSTSIVDKAKNSGPGPPRRPSRPAGVSKVTVKVIHDSVKVRVSYLSVTTEPGAKVILQSLAKTAKPKDREMIADAKGSVMFDDLGPGNYKVQSSKAGFETVEADSVTINPREGSHVPMELKVVTSTLKLETNLTGGEVFYAQRNEKSTAGAGSSVSDQRGNYCVVKIQPNGAAEVADLKKGYYFIDIRPGADSPEFEEIRTGVNVPEDIDRVGGPIQIDLEKKASTETFATTAWAAADWIMPTQWRLDKGMKVKDAVGIALPRNPIYSYYLDFKMTAGVKLNDGGTVGFALRAKDDKNYYLLQISGPRAAEPNIASLYAVKDGLLQPQPIRSVTTAAVASTIASDKGFRVIIQGDKMGFKVSIEDVETGDTNILALMTDPNNIYKKGAVGIAALQKPNFEVKFFKVCTPTCP